MLSSCAAYCQSCHWRLVLLGVKKLKQDVKFIAKNKEKGRTRTVAYYYIYLTRKTTRQLTIFVLSVLLLYPFYLQIFAALQIFVFGKQARTVTLPSVFGSVIIEGSREL